MMESELYRDVFSKWLAQGKAEGKAEGQAEGEAKGKAETIIHILTHRLGKVDRAVREQVRRLDDAETRQIWYNEALMALTAEEARRLADKIRGTIA